MKEELKQVAVEHMPETEAEYMELLTTLIASPEGTAAAFVVALAITAADRETGLKCIADVCFDPPSPEVLEAILPDGKELEEIASSYMRPAALEGGGTRLTVMIKLTDEKSLKRHMKTVYVGCSGTQSYRPLTLISKPPRYLKKRFGIRRDYYEDPWFAADFPSMILPLNRA